MRKLKLDELDRVTPEEFKEQKKFPVSVVLDNIRSGMNVGSFFRTGDAFAVEKIYLTGYTPCPPHKEIFKTAIGASETVEWEHHEEVVSLVHSLKSKGWFCVGIEQTTASVFLQNATKPKQPVAVIFGNEVHGITDELLPLLDEIWEVPQFGTKHSLNVSVCGGIILWEVIRELL